MAYGLLACGVIVIAAAWWLTGHGGVPAPDSGSASAQPAASQEGARPPEDPIVGGIPDDAAVAVVRWVIDGDTIDLEPATGTGAGAGTGAAGSYRLRLLNIDAPEREHAGQPAECLVDEATKALSELAARGSEVRVVITGRDRFGRQLGEAWLPDGRMLGAEVVRAGLAAPVTIDGQDRFRPVVDAAQSEAAAAGRGLHSDAVLCSVPSRVAALEGRVRTLGRGSELLPLVAQQAGEILDELTSGRPGASVAALTPLEREQASERVRAVRSQVEQLR